MSRSTHSYITSARGAKRDHVGQLSYSAPNALCVLVDGDAAVQAVQHHCDENGDRRLVEGQVHRLHDREAGEQRGRREQVG